MLRNFAFILSSANFFKINFKKKYFRNTRVRLSNRLDTSDLHFAKVISRQQNPPLVGKELSKQSAETCVQDVYIYN